MENLKPSFGGAWEGMEKIELNGGEGDTHSNDIAFRLVIRPVCSAGG